MPTLGLWLGRDTPLSWENRSTPRRNDHDHGQDAAEDAIILRMVSAVLSPEEDNLEEVIKYAVAPTSP